jgi:Flp pilus assembly pilin Flp
LNFPAYPKTEPGISMVEYAVIGGIIGIMGIGGLIILGDALKNNIDLFS